MARLISNKNYITIAAYAMVSDNAFNIIVDDIICYRAHCTSEPHTYNTLEIERTQVCLIFHERIRAPAELPLPLALVVLTCGSLLVDHFIYI